jgi:scyllo-inositol 2-dehydrogenase (NADP+)
MPPGALRVAIIGFGVAGRVFHAPLVAATRGMEVAHIVTSDPARRAQAAREYPGARLLASADELWASPTEVDLAVVAAPNRVHVPLARASLRAGVPVVVDKPLAPTAAEGRELVAEAERRGVLLTVFQNRRWDADFLTLKRVLAEGGVGAVARLESRFDRWRPAVAAGAWRESPEPEEAGGLLADLGSHLIDQALVLFGPPVHVYGELDRRRPGAEVEDDVFVALTHRGGERSHLWAGMLAAAPAPRFRLVGVAGTVETYGLDPQEEALRDGVRPDGDGWGRVPEDRWGRLWDGFDSHALPSEAGDYPAFYAAVRDALRAGGPPPVPGAEAVAVLEVIEAARGAPSEA